MQYTHKRGAASGLALQAETPIFRVYGSEQALGPQKIDLEKLLVRCVTWN
jgi:hypothetical protein